MSAARPSSWFRWRAGSVPAVGLEIAPRRVTAVSMSRSGGQASIAAHATEPLPPGAIAPTLNAANVVERDAVVGAVQRALDRVGRPRRVALVIPDTVAKVSLVRFETLPARASDLEQLVRWQVRKAAPFHADQAQVSWTDGIDLPGGGRELVVALMKREIAEEYEGVCTAAGAHAGVVDLATFNLVNLVLVGDRVWRQGLGDGADWLLVHLTPEYSTLAILRGDRLVFYRNRLADAEGHLADLVHQTAMYYEDRLGGAGFSRVIVAGSEAGLAAEIGELRHTLEGRLGSQVETLDPRRSATLTDRIDASPDLLAALAAPTGIVLREA
jgi:type IV pilus assembly protein PilM